MTPRIDYSQFVNLLTSINNKLGYGGFIFLGVVIVVIIGSYITLKASLEASAKRRDNELIEQFKSELSKSVQIQMSILNRDEIIRNSLITFSGQKSYDKKIECWQKLYNMYFEYQKIWGFDEKTPLQEYLNLDKDLIMLRQNFFIETIHLGYELSQKLIHTIFLMREGVYLKRNSIKKTLNLTGDISPAKNEIMISDMLTETEKFLMHKIHSDISIDKFDYDQDILNKMKEERSIKAVNNLS